MCDSWSDGCWLSALGGVVGDGAKTSLPKTSLRDLAGEGADRGVVDAVVVVGWLIAAKAARAWVCGGLGGAAGIGGTEVG